MRAAYVGSVGNGRACEPLYGAMHPGYKKVKSLIFATCHLCCLTHCSYTIYCWYTSIYIYSLISFSPIARVRTGSVAKAGVGSRLNGYRQALLKTV